MLYLLRFFTRCRVKYIICVTWCFSDRASWIDCVLITHLMHWLLFIHKILFSSTCFEPQGGYSCTHAAYGTVTVYESLWWPVGTQLEWELTVGGRLLVGVLRHPPTIIILYYIISYHIIPYHIISYHIVLYYIILYYIILYYIILYYIILYYIILYYIILYYIILYYIIDFK